jgi:DNA-binding NarL/FixJ family response regulator
MTKNSHQAAVKSAAVKPTAVKPARVLIVDDHPAVREALALRISRHADLEVCGEADDVGTAMKLLTKTKPDAAIIDISLKTGNGLDLIKRIKVQNASVRLLVWSMHSETLYAERALRAGALGYITKEQATDRIVEALRKVLQGKVFLSEAMTEKILKSSAGDVVSGGLPPEETLSDRELEVFNLMGEGLDTQQIALRIKVSPKTVETYQARIKEKLKLATGRELIRRAVRWAGEQK